MSVKLITKLIESLENKEVALLNSSELVETKNEILEAIEVLPSNDPDRNKLEEYFSLYQIEIKNLLEFIPKD